MSRSSLATAYFKYYDAVRKLRDGCVCRLCKDVETRDWKGHKKHVQEVHNLHKKTHCPWCTEAFPKKGIYENLSHLASCFSRNETEIRFSEYMYDRYVLESNAHVWCCDASFVPFAYAKHVADVHGLRAGCPWCNDPSKTSPNHKALCLRELEKNSRFSTDPECAICTDRFAPSDSVVTLHCSHSVHSSCVQP